MLDIKVFTKKTAWHKANAEHIFNYRCTLQNLQSVVLPVDALLCRDVFCCDIEHRALLSKYANDITNACLSAAEVHIPMASNRQYTGIVPGWKDEVESVRQNSIFWHNLWVDCGHPHSVVVADIMRRTRATYH